MKKYREVNPDTNEPYIASNVAAESPAGYKRRVARREQRKTKRKLGSFKSK